MDLTSSPEDYVIRRRAMPLDSAFSNAFDAIDSSDEFSTPDIAFSGTNFTRSHQNPPNGTGIQNGLQSYSGILGHGFSHNTGQISTQAASHSYLDSASRSRQRLGEHLGESSAYLQLQNSYRALERELAFTQGELQASRRQYQELLTIMQGMSQAHVLPNASVGVPVANQINMEPPHLRREDCPKVKYWTRQSFLEAKKSRKSEMSLDSEDDQSDNETSGENKMTWYVETLNGKTCTKDTILAIRQLARAIWFRLYREGQAPEKWQRIDSDAKCLYEAEMCRKYPELSYGENNWKVHKIAQDNYSSWYKKNIKDKTRVKEESSTVPCKRPASPEPVPAQKQKSHKAKGKEPESPVKLAAPAPSRVATNPLSKLTKPAPGPSNMQALGIPRPTPTATNVVTVSAGTTLQSLLSTVPPQNTANLAPIQDRIVNTIAPAPTVMPTYPGPAVQPNLNKAAVPTQDASVVAPIPTSTDNAAANTMPPDNHATANTTSTDNAATNTMLTDNATADTTSMDNTNLAKTTLTDNAIPIITPAADNVVVTATLTDNVIVPTDDATANTIPSQNPVIHARPTQDTMPMQSPNPHVIDSSLPSGSTSVQPTSEHAAATSNVKKNTRKARAGTSHNAKNLCKIAWIAEVGGTEDDFKVYWETLDKATKDIFAQAAKEKATNTKKK